VLRNVAVVSSWDGGRRSSEVPVSAGNWCLISSRAPQSLESGLGVIVASEYSLQLSKVGWRVIVPDLCAQTFQDKCFLYSQC